MARAIRHASLLPADNAAVAFRHSLCNLAMWVVYWHAGGDNEPLVPAAEQFLDVLADDPSPLRRIEAERVFIAVLLRALTRRADVPFMPGAA